MAPGGINDAFPSYPGKIFWADFDPSRAGARKWNEMSSFVHPDVKTIEERAFSDIYSVSG